jgi:GrpB-like predicted nucleotidyltransferase (UPF0157 family)
VAEIVICPYDPAWAATFERAREEIIRALAPRVVPVEHIGSTSVPGLAAKPIVDMLIGLDALADADAVIPALVPLGYVRLPELDFDERLFLRHDGDPVRHLSLTERGSDYWKDHLAFRDALRADPQRAAAYAELKQELAASHTVMEDYTFAKTSFVRDTMLAAGHVPRTGWAAQSL